MSDITLQRVGELLRGVFEILWNRPEGLPARDVLKELPEVIDLTEYETGRSPSTHAPRYERIVRLATIPLTRAGWLVKNDLGSWAITDEGRLASKKFANVQDFYREGLRLYEERRQIAPESIMTLELAQEMAWDQVRKYLGQLQPAELRDLLAGLFDAMGYHAAWRQAAGKPQGFADLVVHLDPFGLKNKRIFVQIKHKGQAVTAEGLRAFASLLGQDEYGIVFSTSGFTGEALEELDREPGRRLTTLDLSGFFEQWKKHYEQLSPQARALLPLRAIRFLALLD